MQSKTRIKYIIIWKGIICQGMILVSHCLFMICNWTLSSSSSFIWDHVGILQQWPFQCPHWLWSYFNSIQWTDCTSKKDFCSWFKPFINCYASVSLWVHLSYHFCFCVRLCEASNRSQMATFWRKKHKELKSGHKSRTRKSMNRVCSAGVCPLPLFCFKLLIFPSTLRSVCHLNIWQSEFILAGL